MICPDCACGRILQAVSLGEKPTQIMMVTAVIYVTVKDLLTVEITDFF